MKTVDKYTKILSIGFNQSKKCFICGTERGFHVYTCTPLNISFYRDIDSGIRLIEILNCSNIIAFVGDGKNPQYPNNKVVLWDDNLTRVIDTMNFENDIVALKFRQKELAVILKTKVYLYTIPGLKIFDIFNTAENPMGSFGFSRAGELLTVALSINIGKIYIRNYDKETLIEKAAHESTIACIEISSNSQMFATASIKGTLIRIFSMANGDLLKEVRRGTNHAQIYSICFDKSGKWLACTSDKGTLHIFSISNSDDNKVYNRRSNFRFIKWMIGYFGSEWSNSHYKFHIKDIIVCFENDNRIIVLSKEGYHYLMEFDMINGGECKLLEKTYIF